MQRAYSFLDNTALKDLPNPYGLTVFLVRLKGQQWEKQPAASIDEAVDKFVRYAEISSGTVEALEAGEEPQRASAREYSVRGGKRVTTRQSHSTCSHKQRPDALELMLKSEGR